MSEVNIDKMDFKQLRNHVQLLSDQLAIMQRKYEDILYNLDDGNFSSRFVKEKGNMKTAIEINAEGIKTKVSKEELGGALSHYSTTEQTAEKISTAVVSVNNSTDEKLKNYSTIEQTSKQISASVTETKEYTEEYITNQLANGDYITNATFQSQFDIYADGIYSTVESTYETKSDANSSYSSLSSSISSVRQTANGISTKVGKLENGQYGEYTLFEQTGSKFSFTGNVEIISADEAYNTLELSSGHIQLYPSGYSYSLVDLGMYLIGSTWEPRMRFGRGTDSSGYNGTGWIYKTTSGFGMMYNNGSSIPPTIELKDDGIYIIGNVNFSGGTVTGLPAGGTGGVAVFG